MLDKHAISENQIIENLEKRLMSFDLDKSTKNVGKVERITDGVVVASGLSDAFMGEIISFEEGSLGFILNLEEDNVSIILLGGGENLREGDSAKTTGKLLSINASEDLLGRVVNPLGEPLAGK